MYNRLCFVIFFRFLFHHRDFIRYIKSCGSNLFQNNDVSNISNTPTRSVSSSTWKGETRELQDCDLHKISLQIPNKKTLRSLVFRLKKNRSDQDLTTVMDSALSNPNNDTYEATYQTLKTWFADQVDKTNAFTSMCEALSKIGERSIISKVLLNKGDILSEKM